MHGSGVYACAETNLPSGHVRFDGCSSSDYYTVMMCHPVQSTIYSTCYVKPSLFAQPCADHRHSLLALGSKDGGVPQTYSGGGKLISLPAHRCLCLSFRSDSHALVSWFASIEKLCCLWSQLIQWLTQASWVSLDMYQMPVSQSSCLTPAASKNLGQAGLGSDQARAERVEKCNRCTCTVAMPAHKGTA